MKLRILQAEIRCVQYKYYCKLCTEDCEVDYTVKKVSDFPVPSRDVTINKLSLAGNNLIIPGQREFG
jgi:hypothetical protein